MSSVKGLDKLLNNLDKLPEEVRKDIKDITYANALEIKRNASKLAPINKKKNGGTLRQSGKVFKSSKDRKEISYRVAFLAKYAAYMEFGTGGLVSVPAELKDLALKFKGKGIRKVNLMPQPFLYPSLVKQRPRYLKDLKELLESKLSEI